ncbi:TetR/AcrR family transcriptional regulator [Mycobacterium senriense]|uniref:TetR family transcriptional regulator n=1 Tax=Mycobacterium senriense TaxID=2775496 RepID=A0ABM7SI74_9MYCO|nr:TetR/AcrR family transcriptional regulator [Mycobacterium senriense]BCZ20729.1 TetR family transcriptional regulator [Mycobacterium senriense]
MMDDMPRKTDSKKRMVEAARRLFREHGYLGTALSDVVTESSAPRGSIYFHFPGGKEELATEVILLHASDRIQDINRAAATTRTAAELIAAFVGRERDELVSSDYREGCAVAPIVIESTSASEQLRDATRRAFQDLITTLAARLIEKGLTQDRAVQLATSVWASVEGALVLGRVLRSPTPFDIAIAQLTAAAEEDASVS